MGGRDKARLAETGLPHVTLDVTDAASVAAALKEAGPIDIFVACAGAAATAPFTKTSPKLWSDMLAVNLSGVYHSAQAALPGMIERGWGRFIVIASTASLKGFAYASAYAAAKHGALGFVRSLAVEIAKTGVTANAICPGFTDTDLVAGSLETIMAKTGRSREEAQAALVAGNPQGRLVAPSEIAAAALWLASEDSAAVNGQAIVIDGGETIS